uniref:Ig-like domain-containing protein n=1 Tax=Steinernema glaseri TaxID=37863 RepID=A0A1I7ZG87_9BILA
MNRVAALVAAALSLHVVSTATLPFMCQNLLDGAVISMEETMANTAKPEGSLVTLKCNVFGSPQASIEWFHNGSLVERHSAPMVEQVANRRQAEWLGMSIQNARLRIPCLSAADAGLYTCRAQNPCGKGVVEAHATVTVLPRGAPSCAPESSLAPFISLHTSSRLELEQNKIQLQCRARGPAGFVQWAVVDEQGDFYHDIQKFDFLQKLPNNDLLIDASRIEKASMTFQCSISNQFGTDAVESTIVLLTN